ncbi:YbhB/YbcL family Raf kinase inhibitor-like protein, partial [Kitasatospora indigofera]|uniref:YbhB/YbcL family Raf kinase inhibitor-like protein n=1 Tax=Kitasatospora indigofera TaxID=67307 RepID=UPI0036BCFBC1
LPENAGAPGGALLPAGALTLPNEIRLTSFIGAGPPPSTGVHRYIFAVHALDVARLDLDPASTPAVLGFNLHFHTLARGTITGTATAD